MVFLDWLIAYFIIYFQIWPVSIVNRDKGLDDFIVAAPRFITLSARDRKTSILRAPINTLLYKKAQICAHAYSIIKMGYFILFYLSRRRWNTSRKLWYSFPESKTLMLICNKEPFFFNLNSLCFAFAFLFVPFILLSRVRILFGTQMAAEFFYSSPDT